MRAIVGLIDRLWLLACVLAASCVPSFLLQYRQRMLGRLDQVTLDLAPWRLIAERLHAGRLDALVAHHRASSDATFQHEAQAIQAMLDSESQLQATVDALQGSLFEQFYGLLTHFQWSDAEAVWSQFQPTLALDLEGLTFALVVGAILWLIPVGMTTAGRETWRRVRSRQTAAE